MSYNSHLLFAQIAPTPSSLQRFVGFMSDGSWLRKPQSIENLSECTK